MAHGKTQRAGEQDVRIRRFLADVEVGDGIAAPTFATTCTGVGTSFFSCDRTWMRRAMRSAPPPVVPLTISTGRSGFQPDCARAPGANIRKSGNRDRAQQRVSKALLKNRKLTG